LKDSSAPLSRLDHSQALLEYYKEQLEHGRHTEVQRSTIGGAALALSGAILAELLKKSRLTGEELPYTVALLVLGLLAWLFTAKLYERFRLHQGVARLARDELDPSLAKLRRCAEMDNKAKHPLMFRLKLHILWNLLFGLVSLLGLVTSIICFLNVGVTVP
jgi:hypothetical protein